MHLNVFGRIVTDEWRCTGRVRDHVALDAFVVMPNHVHGIIAITAGANGSGDTDGGDSNRRRDTARRVPTGTDRCLGNPARGLPTIDGAFKSAATRRINRMRNAPGEPTWQRNYCERVIRTRRVLELERIRRYIRENPVRRCRDPDHPHQR